MCEVGKKEVVGWGGGGVAPESAQTHSDNQIARNEVC